MFDRWRKTAVIELAIGCVLAFTAWLLQDVSHNLIMPSVGFLAGLMILILNLRIRPRGRLLSPRTKIIAIIIFWFFVIASVIYAPMWGSVVGLLFCFICAIIIYQARYHVVIAWKELIDE